MSEKRDWRKKENLRKLGYATGMRAEEAPKPEEPKDVEKSPVIDSLERMMKNRPDLSSYEDVAAGLISGILRRDLMSFHVEQEKYGTRNARKIYNEMWKRYEEEAPKAIGDYPDSKEIGIPKLFRAETMEEEELSKYIKEWAEEEEVSIKEIVVGLIKSYMLRDIIDFRVMEDKRGTRSAYEDYAEKWKRMSNLKAWEIKDELGLEKVKITDMQKILDKYFEGFGNPYQITDSSGDYSRGECQRCPYSEYAWMWLDRSDAEDFNKKVQVPCNTAIFEGFLEEFGLDEEYNFNFKGQMCLGDEACVFEFVPKEK